MLRNDLIKNVLAWKLFKEGLIIFEYNAFSTKVKDK